jgi:hypothetical protein
MQARETMITNQQVDKYISACDRGLMTASEFANSFVYDVASTDACTKVASLFERLPEALQHAVVERFAQLKEEDFRRKPLLFGTILSEEELERLRAQLMLTYETLMNSRAS